MTKPRSAEFRCKACGETFTVTPAPENPWDHCLGEECPSYDPELDIDLRIEAGETIEPETFN